MAKKALCVGINDYPGSSNDLSGCVNDANDWKDLLKNTFGFTSIKMLLDAQATKANITSELTSLVNNATAGDVVVFTFSGHGTWIPDTSADEFDGRDEALCAHDNIIVDDDIRAIIKNINKNARLTIISDSCHSGTVTKEMIRHSAEYKIERSGQDFAPRRRFMPPELVKDLYELNFTANPFLSMFSFALPLFHHVFSLFRDVPELLISGCKDNEYSYDAYINGRYNGAMSATAINIIQSDPKMTYDDFFTKLRNYLPSLSYPQSPQMNGAKNMFKNLPLFT